MSFQIFAVQSLHVARQPGNSAYASQASCHR